MFAVRTDTAKLVKWVDHPEWTQLFDLKSDPYEITNLFNKPAAAELQQQMLAEFSKVYAEAKVPQPPPDSGMPSWQANGEIVKLPDAVPTGERLRASNHRSRERNR
jgi:hypothetical protein